jgi:hypothetical protein
MFGTTNAKNQSSQRTFFSFFKGNLKTKFPEYGDRNTKKRNTFLIFQFMIIGSSTLFKSYVPFLKFQYSYFSYIYSFLTDNT